MTDFVMYKGTTQPIYISVFSDSLAYDLATATGATWTCVAYPPIAAPENILIKTLKDDDITIVAQPGALDNTPNTLSFEIEPDDDATLVTGTYAHEARVILADTSEYVVYPYPPVAGTWASFSVIESLTRGTEDGHTASVVWHERGDTMPPVNLMAAAPTPAKPKKPKDVAPSYRHYHSEV